MSDHSKDHAHDHGDHGHGMAHVASVKVLLGTWGTLMVLTVVTVLATKVDLGAKDLAGAPGEKVTEGLDGLRDRLAQFLVTADTQVVASGQQVGGAYARRLARNNHRSRHHNHALHRRQQAEPVALGRIPEAV